MSNFKNLKLSNTILNALIKKGYTIPTPIQLQTIPHLLDGKDLLGIAQTGTGKTAAFALPILDNLSKSNNRVSPNNVRTLILTPTRELASQIVDNIKLYGQDLGFRCGVIFGGESINNQIKSAKQGFDILVATPGRLLDLINQKHLTFSELEIFVLDEADRMLDMGFIGDVRKIIAKLPKPRQSLFFSATMPKDVAALANSILNDPIRVEVTPESTTVEKIDQRVNLVEKANKPFLLQSIIEGSNANGLFLIFSKTKHGANRIMEFLEKQSIKVAAIHGNKSQSAREKALEGFKQGKLKVLVATDIAARGIDIAGITHVINYDIPNHPESYVHRIGRTARAGRAGIAISFCDNSEKDLLKNIEKLIKIKLPIDETQPFHGVKASPSAKSSLDARDRPKSGYKTSDKPRFAGERKPSYFAENRRWKSDGENNGHKSKSSPSSFRDEASTSGRSNNQKSRFPESKFFRDKNPNSLERDNRNRDERPARGKVDFANSRGEKGIRRDFTDKKPRFDFENKGDRREGDRSSFKNNNHRFEGRSSKPSFSKNRDHQFSNATLPRVSFKSSQEMDYKPRFTEERRSNSFSTADKKPRFDTNHKSDRSERRFKTTDENHQNNNFRKKIAGFVGKKFDSKTKRSHKNGGFNNSKPK